MCKFLGCINRIGCVKIIVALEILYLTISIIFGFFGWFVYPEFHKFLEPEWGDEHDDETKLGLLIFHCAKNKFNYYFCFFTDYKFAFPFLIFLGILFSYMANVNLMKGAVESDPDSIKMWLYWVSFNIIIGIFHIKGGFVGNIILVFHIFCLIFVWCLYRDLQKSASEATTDNVAPFFRWHQIESNQAVSIV
jgi:hypothetical protein